MRLCKRGRAGALARAAPSVSGAREMDENNSSAVNTAFDDANAGAK